MWLGSVLVRASTCGLGHQPTSNMFDSPPCTVGLVPVLGLVTVCGSVSYLSMQPVTKVNSAFYPSVVGQVDGLWLGLRWGLLIKLHLRSAGFHCHMGSHPPTTSEHTPRKSSTLLNNDFSNACGFSDKTGTSWGLTEAGSTKTSKET